MENPSTEKQEKNIREKKAFRDEGIPSLLVALAVTLVLFLIFKPLAIIGLGLVAFILYFFRDPNREISPDANIIYAACDGVVVEIKSVTEDRFFQGPAQAVHVFMSPANVHVNRAPITGRVSYQHYQKGKFVPATRPDCMDINERNYIGFENERSKVMICQVAGIMARRVVSWVSTGDYCAQGSKVGMVKFSSGTQHFMDHHVEILVQTGDEVHAGITPIGRLTHDQQSNS